MKFHSMILDDFFPHYDQLRAWADTAIFDSRENPHDELFYPTVYNFKQDIGFQPLIERAFGCRIGFTHQIARFSYEGTDTPYIVHSDHFMDSQVSMIYYLNRPDDCQGGTALCEKDGQEEYFGTPDHLSDRDDLSKWKTTLRCPMRSNRAFFFRSSLCHYSEPAAGFGKAQHDGRLVVIALFNLLTLA